MAFTQTVCSVLVICVCVIQAIEMDYYELRSKSKSKRINCLTSNEAFKKCYLMCPNDGAICTDQGKCLCRGRPIKLYLRVDDEEVSFGNEGKREVIVGSYEDDNNDDEENGRYSDEHPNQVVVPSPVLRHHIAHFCINLDVARECIKRCMTKGRAAFCGKDHVCYCGHRYTTYDKDSVKDPAAIYADFKDLYEKYLGPEAYNNMLAGKKKKEKYEEEVEDKKTET